MMRILVIGHSYMTRFAQAKFESLVNLYDDVSVLAIVPRVWSFGELHEGRAEERDDRRFRVVALPTLWRDWGSRYFFSAPRLLTLLREFRPEIVQVEHEPVAAVITQLTMSFTVLRQRPKFVLFSWENLVVARNPMMRAVAGVLERLNMPRLSQAIAGNDDAVRVLRSKGYQGPIALMPQVGVDTKAFSPGDERALRQRLGLGSSFVVGYAGRLVPEKGLQTLVHALRALGDRDWKLLLVGRGALLPELRAMLREASLGDRLVHVDAVPLLEMPAYFRCMDMFVLPSETTPRWKEQFGHVLIEAMACGRPIVGSSSGFIPQVVDGAGLIFAEKDSGALAAVITRVMSDTVLHDRLAKIARDRAVERYSHESLARRLYELYARILSVGG